jgi:SAM-dependent methyltransferase
MSETARYRHLTEPYCKDGAGRPLTVLDVASQGDPVVTWAWQLDLPEAEFAHYSGGQTRKGRGIQLSGHAHKLPVDDNTLDVLYSSHFLEDTLDWRPILHEWTRVVKKGGKLIILIPDKARWNYAVLHLKQPVNCSHRHEGYPGELSTYAKEMGWKVIEDRLTECHPHDYNILFVCEKL